MANPKLGQDVANKSERKYTTAHIVAKSYLLQLKSVVTVLLLISNPISKSSSSEKKILEMAALDIHFQFSAKYGKLNA